MRPKMVKNGKRVIALFALPAVIVGLGRFSRVHGSGFPFVFPYLVRRSPRLEAWSIEVR
jgi:hypothetical protein